MDKRQFLDELDRELNVLPRSERETYLSYYEELIEDRKEGGMTEEAAVAQTGDIQQIAKDILGERGEIRVRVPSTGNRVLTVTLLVLGFPLWGSLLVVLAAVILVAYVLVWLIPVLLGGGGVTLLGTALFCMTWVPVAASQNLAATLLLLGVVCAAIGVGGLLILATTVIAKYFAKGSAGLTRLIIRPFRRREVIA